MKSFVSRASFAGIAVVLASSVLSVGAASAQVFTERDTTYQLNTTGGLANTTTNYDNVITLPNGGGNQIGGTLTFRTGAQNMVIDTTGAVTTTYTVPPLGTPSEVGDIVNGDGTPGSNTGGTFHFAYDLNNGPDFGASFTVSEVLSGHNVLHFSGGGTGLLDQGGIFVDNIFISGDWSASGLFAGAHTGLTFDPSFTLINDFVYLANIDATLLTISNGSYTVDPNINFYLVGDRVGGAVPEPATWAMMLIGFGGLGAAMRRRRAVFAAA